MRTSTPRILLLFLLRAALSATDGQWHLEVATPSRHVQGELMPIDVSLVAPEGAPHFDGSLDRRAPVGTLCCRLEASGGGGSEGDPGPPRFLTEESCGAVDSRHHYLKLSVPTSGTYTLIARLTHDGSVALEGAAPVLITVPPPTLFVEVPRDRDVITVHDFMLILFLQHSDGRLEPLSLENTRQMCVTIQHPPTGSLLQR